MSLIDMTSQLQ